MDRRVSFEMTKREGAPRSMGNPHDIDVRPKNWLVPVALLTLREKSSYGYELMDRIAGLGFKQINPGTLYRALRKMEDEGLCESKWETSNVGGATCRTYSVTDAGEEYLGVWAEECKKYQRILDTFYLAYDAAAAAGSKQTNTHHPWTVSEADSWPRGRAMSSRRVVVFG